MHISAPYPNPSANTVSFNYRVSADAHLTIYNSIGQSMKDITLTPSVNKTNLQMFLYIQEYIYANSVQKADGIQKLIVAH